MNKFLLLLITFLIYSSITYAQNKIETAYEKRTLYLTKQLLKKLGTSEQQLAKVKDTKGLESLFMLNGLMKKLNTVDGIIALQQFKIDLQKATSLKTAVDFNRERDKIDAKERQEKELAAKERSRNSDKIKIQAKLENIFNSWIRKGEFEKAEQYNLRIGANNVDTLNKHFYIEILKNIDDLVHNVYIKDLKLLTYNTESEKFPLEVTFNGINWTTEISVPISNAEEFKNEFPNYDINFDKSNWIMVDGYLCPTTIDIFDQDNNKNYLIFTTVKEKSPIKFYYKVFVKDPKYATKYFDYSEQQNIFKGRDLLKESYSN